MARDVEFDTVAHDKTGPGLDSTASRFKRTSDRIRKEQDKANLEFGKSLIGALGKVAPKMASTLADSIGKAGPYAVPVLAGAIAAGSPLIGAAVSGAILGGVGAGVAGIGVAIASQDARVQNAADQLWTKFENRAIAGAGKFVQPTLAGLARIDAAADSVDIEGMFADAARFVEPLSRAAASLVEDIGGAVTVLVDNAGPAVMALADGITLIGKELGEGLESLADDGDTAAAALTLLFNIIGSSIDQVFLVVNALTELYGIARKIGATTALETFFKLTGTSAEQADGSVRALGGGTFGTAEVMRTAAGDAETYAQSLERTEKEAEDSRQAHSNLFGAVTSVGEAMDRAKESVRENGRTLSANTEKGRANRTALSNLAGALRQQYDATVAVNGVGVRSAQVAETNRRRFVQLAGQMGVSSTKANQLARSIGLVPTKREARIIAQTEEAERKLRRARELLAQLQSKTITVTTIINERRRSKVENQLGRNGRDFATDAGGSWQAAAPGSTVRTDGPAPVDVTSTVLVDLDGRPFRDYTDRAVDNGVARSRWRSRGKR